MLTMKGDPLCVKMIDFGLFKDFTGTGIMKTMSSSFNQIRQNYFLYYRI